MTIFSYKITSAIKRKDKHELENRTTYNKLNKENNKKIKKRKAKKKKKKLARPTWWQEDWSWSSLIGQRETLFQIPFFYGNQNLQSLFYCG